jgi:hypothetical protein
MQRDLQECLRSAQRWLTSISASIGSDTPGQRDLQEFWGSAQRWLTSISGAMKSALSGTGGFELRGVVKPLALFCRHLALLALCHLFSRQATRKRNILYTYSLRACPLSHQVGRKAGLNAALHSKPHFKRKRGESERWRRSSAGCERVQALAVGPRPVAPRLMPCSSFEV